MSAPVRILGIDPGTANTGFGVIDHERGKSAPLWYDCLTTKPTERPQDRIVRIGRAVREICERMQPEAMAIEELFFGANAKAALAVGQARGVCIFVCGELDIPVYEYSPSSIKQAVTGYGRADKQQVMEMVRHQLGMSEVPRPDHAADALAVAITHAGSMHLDLIARRTSIRVR